MSTRIHTADAANLSIRVMTSGQIADRFDVDPDAWPDGALVIEDTGNMEALFIVGPPESLWSVGSRIRSAVARRGDTR